jgi:hypothetical protein
MGANETGFWIDQTEDLDVGSYKGTPGFKKLMSFVELQGRKG